MNEKGKPEAVPIKLEWLNRVCTTARTISILIIAIIAVTQLLFVDLFRWNFFAVEPGYLLAAVIFLLFTILLNIIE